MTEAQRGTLVVMIPSRDGLIVAADTRHTVGDVSCDRNTKIYLPKTLSSTVVAVTGKANFLAIPETFGPDPCDDIARSPVLLSIPSIVTSYLDAKAVTAAEVQLEELAHLCRERLKWLLKGTPALVADYVGRNIFHVVVASYYPATKVTVIRSFKVDLPTEDEITSKPDVNAEYGLNDQPDYRAFGKGDFLVEHVLNGVGRQFVDGKFDEFLAKKSISEVDPTFAADVATNLIEATSKTSELLQIPTGVGGPIDVLLIGSNGPERLR